nr:hypothetical protein Iba_chr04aCG15830 [Ipomoea batatas]
MPPLPQSPLIADLTPPSFLVAVKSSAGNHLHRIVCADLTPPSPLRCHCLFSLTTACTALPPPLRRPHMPPQVSADLEPDVRNETERKGAAVRAASILHSLAKALGYGEMRPGLGLGCSVWIWLITVLEKEILEGRIGGQRI